MVVLDRLLHRPRALLGVLLVVTLALLPVLSRLKLDGDVLDLLPRSSPAAQAFASYSKNMAASQELMILVTCAMPDKLGQFADVYAQRLAELPQVEQVTHRISKESLRYLREHLLLLLSEEDIAELGKRLTPQALTARAASLRALLSAPGGSAMAPFVTADPLELLPLITRRLGTGLKVDATSGYLRTADGTALLIKVRPRFLPREWDLDQKLLDDAGALAVSLGAQVAGADLSNGPVPQVSFSGAYAFPPYFRAWIERDTMLSTVLSVGAVLLLFGVFFRSLRILPWVLLPLVLAGLWTGVAATLLFGRISGISLAFATILVAIGIDLPIQIYSRLREELRNRESAAEAVRYTATSIAGTSVVATLGPAAVFFSCGLSDFGGLNQLGLLAGIGLSLNCLAMLTVFPALLLLVPERFWLTPQKQTAVRSLVAQLGVWVAKRSRWVLLFAASMCVLALPQVRKTQVTHDLLSIDLGQMPPARTQAEISRRFGEHQRFLVALFEADSAEWALRQAENLQRQAERMVQAGKLAGFESLSTLLPSELAQTRRRKLLYDLDLQNAAQHFAKALESADFAPSAFASFLDLLRQDPRKLPSLTLPDLEKTELAFWVRAHVATNQAARHFVALYLFANLDDQLPDTVKQLQEKISQMPGGRLTGLPLLEQELRHLLQRDLLRITAVSLCLMTLLLVVFYRRLRPVVAVLLPLAVSWVLFFSTLVYLGIPIHLYNLLSVPLIIGYGIDDHVFLVQRFLVNQDLRISLLSTGRAIVLTSMTTVAGFLALLIAHFPGLRQFGLCGAIAVFFCLFAALFILPALLRQLWPDSNQQP